MGVITPAQRRYLPVDFSAGDRDAVVRVFDELDRRTIGDPAEFEHWLRDLSELEAALSEEGAWRYIRMTCDTRDDQASSAYQAFMNEVQPLAEERMDGLHRKLVGSPFLDTLRDDGFAVYLRGLRQQVLIFREANVPLQTELRNLAQEYSATIGAMNVEWQGETMTLPKAAALLEGTDRAEREGVFRITASRRLKDRDRLDDLYSRMLLVRQQVATNAGFLNYRDYAYAALGRFDHTPSDAYAFHDAVEHAVVPVVERMERARKSSLGLQALRPWDLNTDPSGKPPLRPFADGDELLGLATVVFGRLDPYFAECLATMKEMGRLDLSSRDGKAPGGYNYPLYETGAPFIFMNAVGTTDDVVTMLHEGGHAVHSFLAHRLPLTGFKSFPSEIAELASMGMELLTMDHWHLIYSDPEDLRRAKRDQLERVLSILPWVATIDAFQHAVHLNPSWTVEERAKEWMSIHARFSGSVVDWGGLDEPRASLWHKQLHLFELPFYYLEYGIAQLGAIGLWMNYRKEPKATVEAYVRALKLGYTKPLPEIYRAAGIRLDFTAQHVSRLAGEVAEELERLG